MSLKDEIKIKIELTEDLINKWESSIPMILRTSQAGTRTISIQIANKYRFDLYGLFKNELQIPEEYIYPHIRANGYFSSNNYNGDKLTFILLKAEDLSKYLNRFSVVNKT